LVDPGIPRRVVIRVEETLSPVIWCAIVIVVCVSAPQQAPVPWIDMSRRASRQHRRSSLHDFLDKSMAVPQRRIGIVSEFDARTQLRRTQAPARICGIDTGAAPHHGIVKSFSELALEHRHFLSV
jgi:hypothetical protein